MKRQSFNDICNRILRDTDSQRKATSYEKFVNELQPEMRNQLLQMNIPIFYHGSDARILRMPTSERMLMHKTCKEVASMLWQYYKLHCDGNGLLKDIRDYVPKQHKLYNALFDKVSLWASYVDGASSYQYQDEGIYLTTEIYKARDYAYNSFAFGEVGSIAYRMIQGLDFYQFKNFKPNAEEADAINRVKQFAQGSPEPTVTMVDDLDTDNMVNISDYNMTIDLTNIHLIHDVRYTRDINLKPENTLFLKARETC
jgi:hypothetical protein